MEKLLLPCTTTALLMFILCAGPLYAAPADGCGKFFVVQHERGPLEIEYCEYRPQKVEHLVLVVHGNGRQHTVNFESIKQAARSAGKERSTAVIAPRFPSQEDLKSNSRRSTLLYWEPDVGWKAGHNSLAAPELLRKTRISAFTVIDSLITDILERPDYRGMNKVTIAGHSAGGQFVNRYAAGTRLAEQRSKSFHFVIANSSSYLYFNDLRPHQGSDTNFFKPSRRDCPKVNEYHYGLEDLNQYMRQVGPENMKANYQRRQVTILLGDKDTLRQPGLSTTCMAEAQGSNRFERGVNYYHHIKNLFGNSISVRHKLIIVPGIGHDQDSMFRSKQALKVIFEE
ncbi:MAG: hypothetical protein J5J00_11655 [Deltaproteobacteria bacterium]|nr:hypothetical protein [Deltaproteobacteria bacterium]